MAFPLAHLGSPLHAPHFMLGAGNPPTSLLPSVLSLGLTRISLELPPQNLKHLCKPSVLLPKKTGIGTTITQLQNRCFISCVIYLNVGILLSQHFNRNAHNSSASLMAGLLVHFQRCFLYIDVASFSERMHSLINRLPIFPLSNSPGGNYN